MDILVLIHPLTPAHCCLHSSDFTSAGGPSLVTGIGLKLKRNCSAGNSPSKLRRCGLASESLATGGTLLPGGSRTRGTGRAALRADSAAAAPCISDGNKSDKMGWSMAAAAGSLAGERPLAIGDAPDSRAIVTECTTLLRDGQTSFESSTSLVSG